uniref:ABC transporter, ATP-binding/permease protein n=1 Tax=uncultured bacterium contig00032 TaxID=1181521 RepID=A0A806KF87_9BACT|nr:ABC transporter, ATP-binding/permease protein [uncultured bacterium contig00032]
MDQIDWVWNYMKGKRALFIGGLILAAAGAGIRLINPWLSKKIIDDVIIAQNISPLISLLVMMMVVQVVRVGLRYLMIVWMELSSTDVLTGIRRDMYDTVQWQDFRFLGRFPTGNLMTRMTQDLDRLRHTVAWVTYQIVDSIVLFVSTFIFLMWINWQLALSLVAVTPFIFFISRRFRKRIRPRFFLLREKLTALGTTVTENIDGNRVVKAFAHEDYEQEHFEKHNKQFRDTSFENALITAKYQPLLETASQFILVVTLFLGGIFIINGSMTAGEYMAFSALTWALAAPMQMLGPLLADLERYAASSVMIKEVLDAPKAQGDSQGAKDIEGKLKGDIEFKNVNLAINGKPVLENISFNARAGSTIGILGTTGSGKTSLVNLLARIYEPDSGEILLDGFDIKSYKISSLRRQIGMAMQDVFLFSDSVKGNIAYGRPDMDDESIAKRAVQADADSFIKDMGEGYETLVGERGVGISGGQRQRIALARALAVEPAILILDDTTSAVDSETEKYIQNQLKNLDYPCTKIIIAQRISSFRGAEMILVMDKGRIIESGTHSELLANKGFYFNIWSLQYNAGIEAIAPPYTAAPDIAQSMAEEKN